MSTALTTLKFLGNETEYDYIASGSLLDVAISHTSSYPVGYVQSLQMNPMNFKEFLLANNVSPEQIQYLHDFFENKKMIIPGIHDIMNDLFKKYIILGGMPEVVKTYVQTKDMSEAIKIQKQILEDYYRDMAKYADYSDKIKVHDCFISIPQQLSKDNKKFQYKLVRDGGNARMFESSLQWLEDSGIIQKCYRLKCIDQPLKAYRDASAFKVYVSETGLLNAMFEESIYSELFASELGVYKGAIFENIASQMLKANGHDLYYYEPSSHTEIDFILSSSNGPIPIEIKSSSNTRPKSLKSYVEKHNPYIAYKFSPNNISVQGNIIHYPLYLMMFL